MLMASTYPLEVVEAARWAKANPNLKDKALEDALQKQTWDPSVKALAGGAAGAQEMNEKLDWTQKLGDAFLAEQKEVLETVQSLRSKANAGGQPEVDPRADGEEGDGGEQDRDMIESAKPEMVYVPTYNPSDGLRRRGGTRRTPPYYYVPARVTPTRPGSRSRAASSSGAAIWGNCNWGGSNVDINVNKYNNFNKANINNGNFNHTAEHRKGVALQGPRRGAEVQPRRRCARRRNRASSSAAVRSRAETRWAAWIAASCRTASRRPTAAPADRGGAGGDRAGAGGDRAGAEAMRGSCRGGGNRDVGGGGGRGGAAPSAGNLDSSRGSGGFSGASGGASTRDASSRGASSRSSMSGGGGGRGGGGGGRGGGGRR